MKILEEATNLEELKATSLIFYKLSIRKTQIVRKVGIGGVRQLLYVQDNSSSRNKYFGNIKEPNPDFEFDPKNYSKYLGHYIRALVIDSLGIFDKQLRKYTFDKASHRYSFNGYEFFGRSNKDI